MQSQQRQATLRRQGGDIPRRTINITTSIDGSSTLPHPRRCRDKHQRGISTPSSRFARWPKNVFFASDFVSHKTAATASKKIDYLQRSRVRSPTTSACRGTVQRQTRNMGDVGSKAQRRPRSSSGHAAIVREKRAGRRVDKANVLQAGGRENEEKRLALGVGESKGGRFLQESASALLHLHRRFFEGTDGEEDLVCRLCVLCREAGWMGNPRSKGAPCSALDAFAVEEMLILRLRGTKRAKAQQEMEDEHHHRNKPTNDRSDGSANSGVFSFEEFYGVLADIAAVVYPRGMEELEEEGVRSRRAMHRLLVEGVLPLADDPVPRLWSPRPEILYGRPALAALRMQRDALHRLYHAYNGDVNTQSGAKGFRRATFVQMLSDLGVSPTSVSEAHAVSVFDAVVRNGLPDTDPARGRELHGDGVFDGYYVDRGDRGNEGSVGGVATVKGVNMGWKTQRRRDDTLHREDSRLCWSLFLEAMAALAVEAVEDRRVAHTTNTRCCNATKTLTNGRSRPRLCAGTRCHDSNDGNDGNVQESTNVTRKARSDRVYENAFPARGSSIDSTPFGNGEESNSDVERKHAESKRGRGLAKAEILTRNDVHDVAASTSATTRTPNDARDFRCHARMADDVLSAQEVKDYGEQRQRAEIHGATSPGDTHREALRQRKYRHESADGNNEAPCVRQPLLQSRVRQLMPFDSGCTPAIEPDRHYFTDYCHGHVVAIQDSVSGKNETQEVTRPSPAQAVPSLVGRHLARMADQTGCTVESSSSSKPLSDGPMLERSGGARIREAADSKRRRHTVCTGPRLEGTEITLKSNGQDDPALPRSSANLIFEAGVAMGRGTKSGKPQDRGVLTNEVSRSCAADGVDGVGVNSEPLAPKYRLVSPWTGHAAHGHSTKTSNGKLLAAAPSITSMVECRGTEPAPYHGGSPSSDLCFVVPLAADMIGGVAEHASVYLGRPPAQEFASMLVACPSQRPFVETDAATTIVREDDLPPNAGTVKRSRNNGSEHVKVTKASIGSSSSMTKLSAAVGSLVRERAGCRRDFVTGSEVHNVNETRNIRVETTHGQANHTRTYVAKGARYCLGEIEGGGKRRGDDDERGERSSHGRNDPNDHQTTRAESGARMTMEAAGCTAALFEELLGPKVVSIYARYRDQLTALFRRYRNESDTTVQGLESTFSPEPSGYMRDGGIRRFVDDFAALRKRWGRDTGTLHLLVRASRGREWRRRIGASASTKSTASTGLCYPGFLEVLTRMAHAADGRAPLHGKLEALLVALQAEATTG